MPNAISETHRKWCFWLLFPLAAAMNFSYLYIRSPNRKTPWKKAAPGSKTPWLWRTEKPQNCTPKMPNATSEWCFWLLFPLAAAMNFSYLYIRSPNRKTPWKKAAPGSKTPWLWRTEKPQNCTPKMPNATSETHRKWCFWLLFPLAAAMNFSYLYIRSPNRKTPWKKAAPGSKTPWLWRTEKPQNCTPKMPNATSETHRKWCFWLLFPLAAAMNFSYLYIRSPNRKTPWKKAAPGSKTPWLWRTEKPQNCTSKMPNATSETHRKWCFWLLFPLAAAMNFSYLYIRSPNRKTPWKKAAPGSKTPWLWRTEKPQNCTPKMPNATSETHRKWCFWLLFPLAAAMNFSYLYIRSPNSKTPWKKAAPGSKTPWLWRTEKPQNCTPKMPNVTSETHNDAFGSFFLLLLPWILATFTSGPQIGKHHGKKQLPAAKHHGSEGRRSPKIVPRKCLTWLLKPIENDAFGSFFLLLLPWILATFTSGPQIGKHHGKKQLPAAKHHGSEGRRSLKIIPRKCLTRLLKPIENDAFGSFFLLLLPWILATFTSGPQIGKHHGKKQLPAAKHHGSEGRRSPKIVPRKCLTRLLKPIENDAFGSFFLLLLPWILATFTSGPQIGKHHGKKQLPAAKHHGSEGRRSPKIVPRKCLTWLLKPIENDAFGSFFLLLLPWILATFTSGPQIGKHHGKKQLPAAKHHGSEGWLMARQELPAAASAGVCCCLLLPAAACLLLPAAASAGVCWCLLLPAAACCCLPLPAAACGSLLLPAAPCCSLLLPAAGAAASCCCCCGAAVLLLQSNSLQSKKQTARHPFRNTSETAKHHLFAGCLPLPAAACCCPEGSHNLQPKKSTAAAAVAVAVCWVLAADNWLPATCFLTAGCSAAACQLLLPLAAAKT